MVTGSIWIERVHEVLRVGGAGGDSRLDRSGKRATNAEVAEMDEVDVLGQGHKIRFGDGINLRAIELRSKNRKLVGTDIEVLLVDAQQRLIAKAGTAGAFLVGSIDMVECPGSGGVAGRIHRQVGARACERRVDEEDDGEPGIGCFIKVAARVAGKLFQPFAKKHVDVEWAGDYGAIGMKDGEG